MQINFHFKSFLCYLSEKFILMKQEEKHQHSGKRQLKVYEKYFSRSYNGTVILPEIRLCGKWVQDLGFECGEIVTVRHEKNKITITVND